MEIDLRLSLVKMVRNINLLYSNGSDSEYNSITESPYGNNVFQQQENNDNELPNPKFFETKDKSADAQSSVDSNEKDGELSLFKRKESDNENSHVDDDEEEDIVEMEKKAEKESKKAVIESTDRRVENNTLVSPNRNSPTLSFHAIDKHNTTFDSFPWDDGFDYNQICKRLLSFLTSPKGPIIINSGKHGGLGHKFVTLYNMITVALVNNRRLYSMLYFGWL